MEGRTRPLLPLRAGEAVDWLPEARINSHLFMGEAAMETDGALLGPIKNIYSFVQGVIWRQ